MNVPARRNEQSEGDDVTRPAPVEQAEQADAAELVAQSVVTWREALVEAAGGSTLADVGLLGDAALDLSVAHPSGIAQLFAGRPTRLSNLVREDGALGSARRRARAVSARAATYAQQYGIAPTYLAIGLASWTERTTPDAATDDVAALATATRPGSTDATPEQEEAPVSRTVRAPVLLRPVTLQARGTAESDYELSLEPSLEVNPVLARALRSRGALLDPGAVARSAFTGSGFDPQDALNRLNSLGTAVLDDFHLTDRIVVGTFVHPGQVLVDDLDRLAPGLERHELVAALAGAPEAMPTTALPAPVTGDRDPATERGIGDLDPAQQHVLDVVAAGGHVFVDAPADSDVTGTVAALVADAAADGRTVLYVPGHRRAAIALADRLDRLGVGDVLLDIAPDAGWRSAAGRRLLGAMTLEADPGDPARTAHLRASLVAHRERLRGYLSGLHLTREPWGVSAYDAFQALAALTAARPTPSTTVRLDPAVARDLDQGRRTELAAQLHAAAEVGAFTLRPVDTPWYGASLDTAEQAQATLDRVRRLAGPDGLLAVQRRIAEIAEATGFTPATSVREWGEQLTVLAGVRGVLDDFQPLVFERSVADLVAATASKAWRTEHDQPMGYWLRRRLKKQAKDLLRPGRHVDNLHDALTEAQHQSEIWRQHCAAGGWPRLPEGLARIDAEHQQISADLEALSPVLATTPEGGELLGAPIRQITERMERLLAGADSLPAVPERSRLVRGLRAAGLEPLLYDLADRRVPAWLVGPELELAWWSTVFEQIITADPALAGHDGRSLGRLVAEFRQLDLAQTQSLSGPVRARAAAHTRSAMQQHPQQTEALFGELVEDRFSGLLEAMSRYGDVARRLRPVLAAAPMLVPQVLPATRTVDLVVLDAADHLPVEVVLPALARGRQVVVLGDPRCASGSAVTELADVLPRVALHADGSRRDPYLTAFLAGHGYAGVLSPTPLPSEAAAVGFHPVDGTGMPDDSGSVQSTRAEVDRVVELVAAHAFDRPEESLAVITASALHTAQIREAVLSQVRGNPALAAALDSGRPEPFVVTDLTSIAGLRRDAVILSPGFGRTPHGRVLHRFGPISDDGGDGLLLAALGVTRHRLDLVSCLTADQLDPERLRGAGPRLYADLLRFAQRRAAGDPELLASMVAEAAGDPARGSDEPEPVASAEDTDAARSTGSATGAVVSAESPTEAGTGAAASATDAGSGSGSGTAASAEGATAATATAAAPTEGGASAGVPAASPANAVTAALSAPLTEQEPSESETDRLVVDLAERLWRHGLVVELDYGLPGGLRLPMAVGHPDLPGRLLVAVLTDDDAYVREPSIRVRDRQVPERLERLGWSVVRVWSVAAFIDPEAEVNRIRRAVHAVADQELDRARTGRQRAMLLLPDVPVVPASEAEVAPSTGAISVIGLPTDAGLPVGGGARSGEAPALTAPTWTVPGYGTDAELPADGSLPSGEPTTVAREAAEGAASTTGSAGAAPSGQVSTVSAESAEPGSAVEGGGVGSTSADSTTEASSGSRAADPRPRTGALPAVAADIPGVMEAAATMTGALPIIPKPAPSDGPGPRPDVRPGLPISAYSDDQLDELVAWMLADGQERTQSQLAAELRLELGVTRRGARVDAVVTAAVRRALG
ncbi:hypothetical protein [Cellulomonas sp. NPDC089187]|uniref:hypothetical protein n=1 Tax=Cellulomonas sp. NPDC089187 TaxID=3154970 RepID=UPI00341B0D5E